MLAAIREFFKPRQCTTCVALRAHIAFLEDEIRVRRQESENLRLSLCRALRIEPIQSTTEKRAHVDPVDTGRGAGWNNTRQKLEAKFKRQGPGDERKAYWADKISEMESKAGIA